MPGGPAAPPILYSFPTNDQLIDLLAQFVVKVQKDAIDKKGRFTIALSGGSLPKQLKGLIGRPGVKWDKWLLRTLSRFVNATDMLLQASLLR
jgi:6-phosphogluconolactonase